MTRISPRFPHLVAFGLGALFALLSAPAHAARLVQSQVESVAKTNMPGLTVVAKTSAAQGELVVNGAEIKSLKASFGATTMKTGMEARDTHMYKHIFAPAGSVQKEGDELKAPDVVIEGNFAACTRTSTKCDLAANVTIAGVTRPYSFPATVSSEGDAIKLSAEPVVKLSDFGIKEPSQMGVKVKNEVALKLEGTFR